jgi:hypothetical protein
VTASRTFSRTSQHHLVHLSKLNLLTTIINRPWRVYIARGQHAAGHRFETQSCMHKRLSPTSSPSLIGQRPVSELQTVDETFTRGPSPSAPSDSSHIRPLHSLAQFLFRVSVFIARLLCIILLGFPSPSTTGTRSRLSPHAATLRIRNSTLVAGRLAHRMV